MPFDVLLNSFLRHLNQSFTEIKQQQAYALRLTSGSSKNKSLVSLCNALGFKKNPKALINNKFSINSIVAV